MGIKRKRHNHPKLVPPSGMRNVWNDEHTQIIGREYEHQNDNGKEINGRVYIYHPTKGWRNVSKDSPEVKPKTVSATLMQSLGFYGSRKLPFRPVETREEPIGTVTRQNPPKALKQARKVLVTTIVPVGKYIPAGEHMKLGKASV